MFIWECTPKESLNSTCQQFYQYQQSKQSHITSTHWILKKRTTTYYVGNPGHDLG